MGARVLRVDFPEKDEDLDFSPNGSLTTWRDRIARTDNWANIVVTTDPPLPDSLPDLEKNAGWE